MKISYMLILVMVTRLYTEKDDNFFFFCNAYLYKTNLKIKLNTWLKFSHSNGIIFSAVPHNSAFIFFRTHLGTKKPQHFLFLMRVGWRYNISLSTAFQTQNPRKKTRAAKQIRECSLKKCRKRNGGWEERE